MNITRMLRKVSRIILTILKTRRMYQKVKKIVLTQKLAVEKKKFQAARDIAGEEIPFQLTKFEN